MRIVWHSLTQSRRWVGVPEILIEWIEWKNGTISIGNSESQDNQQ